MKRWQGKKVMSLQLLENFFKNFDEIFPDQFCSVYVLMAKNKNIKMISIITQRVDFIEKYNEYRESLDIKLLDLLIRKKFTRFQFQTI